MGRDAMPVGQDRSEDPPRGPGGIVKPFRRPSRRARRGRESFLEGWEWLGDPPGGPEVV